MNLKELKKLGDQVEVEYKSCDFDDALLPEIAASALKDFDFEYQWEPSSLADYPIKNTPYTLRLQFSDFPITVYRGNGFFIEILNWLNSTTTIHQHSFTGAFKVLLGSSIHSNYDFATKDTINTKLLIGELNTNKVEYLSKGSIRKITPGNSFIHSLYHLEQPSATLVIRSNGDKQHGEQYDYYPPGIALSPTLKKDSTTIFYQNLISSTIAINSKELSSLLSKKISKLSPEIIFQLFLSNRYLLNQHETFDSFYNALDTQKPGLSSLLIQSLTSAKRSYFLRDFRDICTDEDLRFFIAALMNLEKKDELLSLVKQKYLNANPAEVCAGWLNQLADLRTDLAKRVLTSMNATQSANYRLGIDIASSLPMGLSNEEKTHFFLSVIDNNHCDFESEKHNRNSLDKNKNQLKTINELAPLFNE